MGRRKGSSRVEPEIATFVTSLQGVIAPWLAGFGFSRAEKDVSRYAASASFINGTRYVRLSASSEPRDLPSYCNVVLGEGSLHWPEVDWNGIALWRLARDQGSQKRQSTPLKVRSPFSTSSGVCVRISNAMAWDFSEVTCPRSGVCELKPTERARRTRFTNPTQMAHTRSRSTRPAPS